MWKEIMEQLICTARNIRVFLCEEDEDKKTSPVRPEIEAVLTTMDRTIQFVGAGLSNTEQTKTIRFTMSPEGARKLAQSLNEWADEAEEKAEKIEEGLKLLEKQDEA
jgi:hypothetical protein